MEYTVVIERLALLEALDRYDPVVIGTPPLGIGVESSDIDVACHAPDLCEFASTTLMQIRLPWISIWLMVVRRQPTWDQWARFLRDTFLPVASPV